MSTDAFNNISFYAFKMTVLNKKPYEIWTIKTYNVPYVKIFLDLIFYFVSCQNSTIQYQVHVV